MKPKAVSLVPFNGSPPCCLALSKCHRVAQSYCLADNFRKGNNDSNAPFQLSDVDIISSSRGKGW